MQHTYKFEDWNPHDNHIHAFRIIEGDDGTCGTLVFDIDAILEWLPPEDGCFSFRLAPADLVFTGVLNLQVAFNYKTCSAATGPMSIDHIECIPVDYPNGYQEFEWIITLNWPEGVFRFTAKDMQLRLRKEAIVTSAQYLEAGAR